MDMINIPHLYLYLSIGIAYASAYLPFENFLLHGELALLYVLLAITKA
ncbi:hypothetical protein [Rhizobium sp. BG4]|nr:hypothetical protein [Rhizobium sp. BG4]